MIYNGILLVSPRIDVLVPSGGGGSFLHQSTFTAANGTNVLTSYTPDVGPSWQNLASDTDIIVQNNYMRKQSSSASFPKVGVDVATTLIQISYDFQFPSVGGNSQNRCDIYYDVSNFWRVTTSTPSFFGILDETLTTVVSTSLSPQAGVWYTMNITISDVGGSHHITANVDGANEITTDGVQAMPAAPTGLVGLSWIYNTGQDRDTLFDNVEISAA